MSDRTMHVGPLLQLVTTRGFERLPQQLLAALATEAEEVVVARGEVLQSARDPAHAIHVVVDGRVGVTGPRGPESVGPGEVVGLVEVLAREAVGSEAIAEVDTVALRIDGDALREAQERHFGIVSRLLEEVASRILPIRSAVVAAVVGAPEPEPLAHGLDRVQRLLALHRSPAFPSASMDALAELAGHLTEVRFEPGAPLWKPGDPSTSFFVLCSGSVRLSGAGWEAGAEIGPGGVPGMPETLAGSRRLFEAVASESTTALVVAHEALLDLLEDHFEMASAFLARLAGILLASEIA